ncbi:hypothetical protein RFI_30825 [Reticulomyxa filosa]|uniref:Uncharacterized protein n=1 Tax=Reticulomyxa filosa TaxID=46433 RepID=X6LZI9_RETFI|nr:hypothetical protein RFI_30825 [Reticulomyxa filosa]|eukprot:ETO06567.1 hypothetical protein RFI_30825 [Reticulomyxa filosa]
MAQGIIEEMSKDIGKFFGTFALAYITKLLNNKIQGAIEDIIKSVKLESKEDPQNEEKKLEDKLNNVKPLDAGAVLLSYKSAWEPDHIGKFLIAKRADQKMD